MSTTKELLTVQFEACYNVENWFKPLKDVLSDLTDEEFKWKENENLHSIRQLVIHLLFWNERYYFRFKGTPLPGMKIEANNDPTFDDNELSKEELLDKFYKMMDDFLALLKEASQERFDEKTFFDINRPDQWWETLHCVNIHTAYHLGQIMLIKKQIRTKN